MHRSSQHLCAPPGTTTPARAPSACLHGVAGFESHRHEPVAGPLRRRAKLSERGAACSDRVRCSADSPFAAAVSRRALGTRLAVTAATDTPALGSAGDRGAMEPCMLQSDRSRAARGLVPRAPSSCRIRRAPAARVRGPSTGIMRRLRRGLARWGTLHSAPPLHWEKPGAAPSDSSGFLLLATQLRRDVLQLVELEGPGGRGSEVRVRRASGESTR
jgi:hypothetical protein